MRVYGPGTDIQTLSMAEDDVLPQRHSFARFVAAVRAFKVAVRQHDHKVLRLRHTLHHRWHAAIVHVDVKPDFLATVRQVAADECNRAARLCLLVREEVIPWPIVLSGMARVVATGQT